MLEVSHSIYSLTNRKHGKIKDYYKEKPEALARRADVIKKFAPKIHTKEGNFNLRTVKQIAIATGVDCPCVRYKKFSGYLSISSVSTQWEAMKGKKFAQCLIFVSG